MDCYKVLRLRHKASSDDIEKAANRMMAIWNPSDYDNDYRGVALCVVDNIKKAKRILMDPLQRMKHDMELNEAICKWDKQSRCPRVEIVSDAGLPGSYDRPWVNSHYRLDEQETNADRNLKYIKGIKMPDGNVESLAFSEINNDPKYEQYLTSTPNNDKRHEMEGFQNVSNIQLNSVSNGMSSYPQINIDVLKESFEVNDTLFSNKSEDLNMNMFDLNDAIIFNETECDHKFSDVNFVGISTPAVNKVDHLGSMFDKISISPAFTKPTENYITNGFNREEDCSTLEEENDVEILQRTILKNGSKATEHSNLIKCQTFEIEYSLCVPKLCNQQSLRNVFGNIKCRIPIHSSGFSNSSKSLFKHTKNSEKFPDLKFIAENNYDCVKDNLPFDYLDDTLKFKFSSSEPIKGNNDEKTEIYSESYKDFIEYESVMGKETCANLTNSELFLNNELIKNYGLIDELNRDCPEISTSVNKQNDSLTHFNKDYCDNKEKAEFSGDALSMEVNVSIKSLKDISDLDLKNATNNIQVKNSNGCKRTTNHIFQDNPSKNLFSLDISDVEVG
ncbi:hypothetical protein AVEN_116356-1, partial [Araneus ventricosus]